MYHDAALRGLNIKENMAHALSVEKNKNIPIELYRLAGDRHE